MTPERPPRPATIAHLADLRAIDAEFASTCSEANLGGQVFGGQLMAQAVAAAARGLAPERRLCSISATFLRPVPTVPLVRYRVRPLMGGRSFDFAAVESGAPERPDFQMNLLFQQPESGAEHQAPMPAVPGPDELPELTELAVSQHERLSTGNARVLATPQLYLLRPVDAESFLFCAGHRPRLQYWMKSRHALPDDPRLHEIALVFFSDAWINSPMLLPHVDARLARDFMAPTLSHQLWVHREFRMDDWLLFDVDGPSLHGATGLVNATVFDRQGRLVASAAQHSLFRRLPAAGRQAG